MITIFKPTATLRVQDQEMHMPVRAGTRKSGTRPLRSGAAVAMAALVATAIAACDTPRVADDIHPRLTDHKKRHPITLVAETATLDVAVATLPKGGEARAFIETTRFVRNYNHEGRGDLIIAVPRGARASTRIGQLRLAAHRAGVPSQRIRVVSKPGAYDTITMSYDRIAAIGPTCGNWSSELSRDRESLPYQNFGCSSQRNLAAMTANPTDLMLPANEGVRGSETRGQDAKNFKDGIGKPIPNAGSTK
jgi:pilus assembly protein CpaD